LKIASAKASSVTISKKDTLNPVIIKLKDQSVGILTEFEAKKLEAIAKMRNDAAHGASFNYTSEEIQDSLDITRKILEKILERQ
jgi:hypothetical protein